ncbi:MAG: outer membrane lipoprotein-sorting protein [Candidatus Binatia bacterium]
MADRWRSAVCFSLLLIAAASSPASAAETAQQILDRREAIDAGARWWNDRYQRMHLTVEEAGTAPRHLTLETYDRRQHGRQQQSLVIFLAPAAKAGIALLGHTQGGAAAAQWLYMPETARVRQVAPSARMNRFDITDFTYHDLDVLTDMTHWKDADARSTLLPPEIIDGVACHVIDLEPRLEHVAYGRIRLWLGGEDLVARQIEFYVRTEVPGLLARFFGDNESADDRPIRRFRQKDIRNVGPIPVAYRIEAESPPDDSRTIVEILDVSFDRGLTDAFFSPGSLGTKTH